MTTGVLCIQSLGHIIGIIFSDNAKIAVFIAVQLFVMFFLFCNFVIPIEELHYSLQLFSNISTVKLVFENILILFYGFDRCSDTEFSSIMFVFGLEDRDFYRNSRILIFQFIFLRSLSLIVLLFKANSFTQRKKAKELRDIAVKTLNPPNAYILGLTPNYNFKIKL